jgi:DNA polymerase III subunit delta'
MRLSEVIGQPGPVRLLTRLLARDRLPHAVLIEGPPGCGRRTLSRAVAAALLCLKRSAGDACGDCDSCRLAEAGTHPDLVALPHDSEGNDPDVELVRTAVAEAAYASPLIGDRRVFLLPGIERLALPAANALLKVLEEPPRGAYLLLTTDAAAGLLRTIRSRAQLVRLMPLAVSELERVLVRGGVPASAARERALLGHGSHRGLWQDAEDAPLDDLVALCAGGYSARLVGALIDRLPRRANEEAGRTVAAEQRRTVGRWLLALLQRLRGELVGADGARTAELMERVIFLQRDLERNINPQLVIEGLGLNSRT